MTRTVLSDSSDVRSQQTRAIIEGACWLAFSAAAFAFTFGFDDPLPMFDLGAAFWPRVMLFGIAATALVLIVGGFVFKGVDNAAANPSASTLEGDAEDHAVSPQAWHARIRILLMFGVPVLYVYAMHQLGFLLVTPFFLLAYMYVFGVRRWVPLLSVTAGVYAAVVLIFVKLIFTPMPQGAGVFYTVNGYLLGLIQ